MITKEDFKKIDDYYKEIYSFIKAVIKTISGQETINQLKLKRIIIKCRSEKGIAEEAPLAYKNVEDVAETVHRAGLSKKVAKLVPLAVIKGE